MNESGVRSSETESGGTTLLNSSSERAIQRRKFLGGLGFGLVGLFALRILPGKLFSKKVFEKRNRFTKIQAIPNDLAVKRGKKV